MTKKEKLNFDVIITINIFIISLESFQFIFSNQSLNRHISIIIIALIIWDIIFIFDEVRKVKKTPQHD